MSLKIKSQLTFALRHIGYLFIKIQIVHIYRGAEGITILGVLRHECFSA